MAFPTQGSGTETDPWQIEFLHQWQTVVRTAGSPGFYRFTKDIDPGVFSTLTPITVADGDGYAAKVIDGNGFSVRHVGTQPSSSRSCQFAGIHFKNIKIMFRLSMAGNYSNDMFYRCSLTDVAVYASVVSSYKGTTSLVNAPASTPSAIPREVRRVVLFKEGSPAEVQPDFLSMTLAGVTATQTYVYTTGATGTGLTKRSVPLTLTDLDGLTSNAFSDNGWWQTGAELLPWQSELVVLTVQTIADGVAVSRRLWVENEYYTRYIGDTNAAGVGQYNVRIRKWGSFTLYASEDFAADELRSDKVILANAWYLPPTSNGQVYQAGSGGKITTLAGVTFSDQPVTVDGILFTPRPIYKAVLSGRSSVLRGGAAQTILLDNSGGGGPVLEGEPAYLEGVVEEIHPMLGTVRALAGAEVLAFERREGQYVAIGGAYSNAFGEFRVETDVYGGGDIFAFAADFPGATWQAGMALSLGDKVRPTQNNGYVYEVITAGVAGASEPNWWADQGDGTEGYIGTARAKARPYYQPQAHGPLKMTLVTP